MPVYDVRKPFAENPEIVADYRASYHVNWIVGPQNGEHKHLGNHGKQAEIAHGCHTYSFEFKHVDYAGSNMTWIEEIGSLAIGNEDAHYSRILPGVARGHLNYPKHLHQASDAVE